MKNRYIPACNAVALRAGTFTALLLALGFLALCALVPWAQAVVPAPDGGYPGGNTAEGQAALLSRTTGTYNTAVGIYSLLSLTDGNFCTGVGAGTLLANTGDSNTATGAGALLSNTTGTNNTADGTFALFSNTEGSFNTGIGRDALLQNIMGSGNTATGHGALTNNDADGNTANGFFALHDNTAGIQNTAIGQQALAVNESDDNTATGFQALFSNTTGFFNTASGVGALQNVGLAGDSNTTRIGIAKTTQRTFIDGIRGVTTGINDAVNVVIDSGGQLGTVSSSRRFKTDIKPMDDASGSILALKPVTFRYKSQKDAKPQFGLIAEEVAEVNPDLVVRDENGEIYTVRYDQVNAMLLNEFLKEHRKVEELKSDFQATIARQQKEIQALTAQLKEQAAQIEKVSAKISVSKPTPQVVSNNP